VSVRQSIAIHVRAAALTMLLIGSVLPTPVVARVAAVAALPLIGWELGHSRRALLFVLPLFAALALPSLHGRDGLADLVTLTLLAALGACLLRDRAHVLAFARTWLVAGTALAIAELLGLTLAGAAWISGSALVALVWLALQRCIRWEPAAAAGSLLATSLIEGGAGRALAAAVVGSAFLIAGGTDRRGVRIAALAVAGLAIVVPIVWTPAIPTSTWRVLADHPFGMGWGNGSAGALWLDVAIEAGWAPAVIVVAATCWVLVRVWRTARAQPAAALVLGLLVSEIIAVSVAGTVSARAFWAFLTAGWLAPGWLAAADHEPAEVEADLVRP
jgi:hypothetical protein